MVDTEFYSYNKNYNSRNSIVKDLTSWGEINTDRRRSSGFNNSVQSRPRQESLFIQDGVQISYNPDYYTKRETNNGLKKYEGIQRTFIVQQQHDYFVKSIVKSTLKTYQQKKLDRLNRILRITGTTWGLIAVSLIIVSAIGASVPQQTTGYKCLYCPAKEYYHTEQRTCLPQLLNSFSCSSTVQCRNDLGLSCRNSQCSCSDRQHWNTDVMMCVDFKTYMDNCNSTNLCGSPLYCTNTSACNCPSSFSASYQCDCPKTVNNEYFWNNVSCQPALSFGGVCSANYMCQTLTQYTLCTSSMCQCVSLYYFSTITSKCVPKLLESEACLATTDCRVDLGLSCQSGYCKCNAASQFWNVTQCINYFTYNNEACTNTTQCSNGLECRFSGSSCSCPSTVPLNKCDCPARVSGSEYYYNTSASLCIPALTYTSVCTSTYMCQTLTQNTICSSGTCKCASLQYFNTITSKCEPQLMQNIACSLTTDCRVDLGLSCQGGLCLCDTSIQFWTGTMCTNYYTYNTQVCVSNSECNTALGLICRTSGISCNCPSAVVNKCDCPTRVSGNEYFWNGTACEPARGNNKTCTATYMCQSLTNSFKCYLGTCNCGVNSTWSASKSMCLFCDAGWTYRRGSCFQISTVDYPLVSGTIQDGCYGKADSRLALLYNTDVSFFSPLFSIDYAFFNDTYVLADYDTSFWCLGFSYPCNYILNNCIRAHTCHGHNYWCEYVLV